MPSIHFTNTFFEAMTKVVQEVYVKEGNENPNYWKEVFNTPDYDEKRRFFQNHSIVPLGLLAQMGEGGVADTDSAQPGLTMQFEFQNYGLRYIITQEAREEDPKAIFNLLPRMLRRSVDDTMEYMFWLNLNLSFLSAAQGGYNVDDGFPLIYGAHTLTGVPGVTQSNFVGNTAFTVESLQAVRTMMALTLDDRGKLTPYVPKNIIYAPGYHQQVTEVVKSDMYPSTDQNRINIVAQQRTGLECIEVPYLVPNQGPGPYPWWVTTAKGSLRNSHSMFAVVKKNEQRSWVDPNTQNLIHQAKIRVSWGVDSYRGIVGSGGA